MSRTCLELATVTMVYLQSNCFTTAHFRGWGRGSTQTLFNTDMHCLCQQSCNMLFGYLYVLSSIKTEHSRNAKLNMSVDESWDEQ